MHIVIDKRLLAQRQMQQKPRQAKRRFYRDNLSNAEQNILLSVYEAKSE